MPSLLATEAQQALYLSVWLALPIVAVAALVSLVTAALQAATQIQDATVAHLPRLLATLAALALAGPWMAAELARFATRAFEHAGHLR